MWTDTEQARFLELRERHQEGETLTVEEQKELSLLNQKALAVEDRAIATAVEEKGKRNEEIAQVIERKRLLIAEAEQALERLRTEQKSIDAELARLLPSDKFAQLVTERAR